MANIVSALAKATGKTAKAPFKEAKDYVSRQVDPSKAIYGLGLGVGPLIKSTVDEYKRQRAADNERKSEAKEAGIDRKAIKQSSQSSASALGAMAKQLNTIAVTMREVRDLNRQQLRLLGGRTTTPTAKPTLTPSSLKEPGDSGGVFRQGGMDLFSGMGGLLGILGTAGKVGLAGIAGSLLYANRDNIKAAMDEFLKGAGLGDTNTVAQEAQSVIEKTVTDAAEIIGKTITEAISATWKDLKPALQKQFGLPVTDENGNNPATGKPPGVMDYVNKRSTGSVVGGFLGGRLFGLPGAAAGAYLGSEYSDEALAAGSVYGSYKLTEKLGKAAIAKRAAEAAQAAEVAQAAAAVKVPNIPAPGSLAPSGYSMSPGGIILQESSGRGARTAADASKISEAATKQITMLDKVKAAASETVDDVARMASNPAFKSVMSWAGKTIGALGTGITIAQAYDDIKDGDYAAATVRLSGLVASLGLATVGSAVATPVIGVSSSLAVGVSSGLLADQLKNKQRAPIADTMPEVDAMGNPTGLSMSGAASQRPATPIATTATQVNAQAQIRAIDNRTMPVTAPTATQTAGGSYKIPIDGNIRVVGGYGEPRQGHTHAGVDIPAREGTAVKAVADGTVWSAKEEGGYGLTVRIKHDDGKWSLYAHLGSFNVKPGQRVRAGDVIGTVGMSGSTMGPHLHLEIHDADGKSTINPYQLLPGLPRYSGKPVAGVTGADSYDGAGPSSMAISGAGITSSSAQSVATQSSALMSNPFDTTASREQLRRMGFAESEIPELLEAQRSMRDLMNIGNEIQAMFLGGDGGGGSSQQSPQGGGGNQSAPSPIPDDSEKLRLMELDRLRASGGRR